MHSLPKRIRGECGCATPVYDEGDRIRRLDVHPGPAVADWTVDLRCRDMGAISGEEPSGRGGVISSPRSLNRLLFLVLHCKH
jgi:hypothetical protein